MTDLEQPSTELTAPPRTTPFTPDDEDQLLTNLHEALGNLTTAAQALGYRTASQVETYAKHNPAFAARLADHHAIAKRTRRDRLISRYYDVLLNGAKRTEHDSHGRIIRTTITDDPKALAWAIEREAPEQYHLPTRHEHTGRAGGPITFTFPMNDDEVGEDIEAEDGDWEALD